MHDITSGFESRKSVISTLVHPYSVYTNQFLNLLNIFDKSHEDLFDFELLKMKNELKVRKRNGRQGTDVLT
jgi:hypothetical protein